jgi:glyoxylase-like metal-dependent hydrolase (beta-lactamase superfamily II)
MHAGKFTIHRVIEEEGPLFDPLTFFPKLTPELLQENKPWLEQSGALDPASGRMVLCIQSYVVRTPRHTILIDSCVGNDKQRPALALWHLKKSDAYMRNLAAAGFGVDDIDIVMCTHLHVDHVGWNTRLENGRWVPTFPKARYMFSEREFAYWNAEHAKTPNEVLVDSVLPIVAAGRADLVRSDHVLDDDVRLMPTPGHTPDHYAVRFGAGADGAVMSGDLMHSPLQARYPELSMRVDTDQAHSALTRRAFLEEQCEAGALVCTAHFPSPSMGRFSRWGEGFRFNAAAT